MPMNFYKLNVITLNASNFPFIRNIPIMKLNDANNEVSFHKVQRCYNRAAAMIGWI